MSKPQARSKKLLSGLATGLLLVGSALVFQLQFINQIYPAVTIADIPVAGLTPLQAKQKLIQTLYQKGSEPISLKAGDQTLELKLFSRPDEVSQTLDLDQAIDNAWQIGRSRFYPLSTLLSFKPAEFDLKFSPNKFTSTQIDQIDQAITKPAINAQINIAGDKITISPAKIGETLDRPRFYQQLVSFLQANTQIALPTKVQDPGLTTEDADKLKGILEQVKKQPLSLKYQDQTFNLSYPDLLNMFSLDKADPALATLSVNGITHTLVSVSIGDSITNDFLLHLDDQKLTDFVTAISIQINRPVEEPVLEIDQSKKRATRFQPPQIGLELQLDETKQKIKLALTGSQSEINLPVKEVNPKNQLTNQMGIRQLLARGTSRFAGSIPNRVYNVGLTAQKLNGAIVAPGEEFSFDQTIGDITAATGFRQAYVIKSGRTVLDDGGGVCQVSTTLFRTALNAGVPITARTAHAYRVHYYEEDGPPGIDATIFYPSVDLKFKNDTPGYILIQSYTGGPDDLSLYVDFYGSADGRLASITTPVITNQTPPPPELRQDDPTLPKGQIKQVDFAAWGANITFKRTVTKAGQTLIKETYYSNYRPWQAIYLVGTKE